MMSWPEPVCSPALEFADLGPEAPGCRLDVRACTRTPGQPGDTRARSLEQRRCAFMNPGRRAGRKFTRDFVEVLSAWPQLMLSNVHVVVTLSSRRLRSLYPDIESCRDKGDPRSEHFNPDQACLVVGLVPRQPTGTFRSPIQGSRYPGYVQVGTCFSVLIMGRTSLRQALRTSVLL